MTLETNGELRELVTDLRVAIGKLETLVEGSAARDIEDRGAAAKSSDRLTTLESWQSRIKGQIALIYFLIGVLTAVGAGRLFGVF
jgi:hypothetical protein